LAALTNAIDTVEHAPEGRRNVTLNAEAFGLARFIQNDTLSREEVENGLGAAAEKAGLANQEIKNTLRSAINARERKPREIQQMIRGWHQIVSARNATAAKLVNSGMSLRQVAKQLGVGKDTVRRAVSLDATVAAQGATVTAQKK
jgi:DNA-binding NarL/FixJ family response regulator